MKDKEARQDVVTLGDALENLEDKTNSRFNLIDQWLRQLDVKVKQLESDFDLIRDHLDVEIKRNQSMVVKRKKK